LGGGTLKVATGTFGIEEHAVIKGVIAQTARFHPGGKGKIGLSQCSLGIGVEIDIGPLSLINAARRGSIDE